MQTGNSCKKHFVSLEVSAVNTSSSTKDNTTPYPKGD